MAIRFAEPAPKPKKPSAKEQRENEVVRALAFEEPAPRGRGRPSSGKETVTLRVDAETMAFYKTFGQGWRDAMIKALDKGAYR